jgi:translation initiation factor RLI1
MDKIRIKTEKSEVSLHMDIQHYVDEFLEMLRQGESLKNALATVILDEAASTWIDRHNDYISVGSKINICPENQSATFESQLVHIDDYDKPFILDE